MPIVSVIMPVYNAERFLAQAIESILKQTFKDFEFIIIDDCSTDTSLSIVNSYQEFDQRIIIWQQPENKGVVHALNQGCSMARGTYIARMDADDISLPERFEKQVQFLDSHLDVGVLGTSLQHIDADNHILLTENLVTQPNVIYWLSLFACCLAHPSVMFRRSVIQELGYYDLKMRHAEDYELWTRALKITKLANLPDILFQYRRSSGALTVKNLQAIEETVIDIIQKTVSSYFEQPIPISTAGALRSLIGAEHGKRPTSLPQLHDTANLLIKLYKRYTRNNQLNNDDIGLISLDVALKLQVLAFIALQQSPLESILLFARAMNINFRSIFKTFHISLAKLRTKLKSTSANQKTIQK